MSENDFAQRLVGFVRENLLPADSTIELDEQTPLLEAGILDSLKTAILLNYIRDELGVHVSPALIDTRNFANVRSLAAMVDGLLVASR
jgi:clorobiocin biosynthesis protein CloN5